MAIVLVAVLIDSKKSSVSGLFEFLGLAFPPTRIIKVDCYCICANALQNRRARQNVQRMRVYSPPQHLAMCIRSELQMIPEATQPPDG